MEQTQPSTMKYIGAWLLAGFTSSILVRVADTVLGNAMVSDLSDMNAYFIVGAAVNWAIFSGSFIFIYNLFKSLNIKKVMIYLYVLGGLGMLAGMGQTSNIYQGLGVDLTVYFLSHIIGFVAATYLIRSYYIKKPDRWF